MPFIMPYIFILYKDINNCSNSDSPGCPPLWRRNPSYAPLYISQSRRSAAPRFI